MEERVKAMVEQLWKLVEVMKAEEANYQQTSDSCRGSLPSLARKLAGRSEQVRADHEVIAEIIGSHFPEFEPTR